MLRLSLLFALGCAGCGPEITLDPDGQPIAATTDGTHLLVPVQINGGKAEDFFVDTGAPTGLAPGLGHGSGFLDSLSVGPLSVRDLYVDPSPGSTGLLGADVLGRFVLSLDYDKPSVTLSTHRPTVSTKPVAFSLVGGDRLAQVPPTRIFVEAMLEGQHYRFLFDTGSDSVALRSDIARRLMSDGRRSLPTQSITIYGSAAGAVFRARGLQLGDASWPGVVCSDGVDDLIGGFEPPLDGLIGGSFLRQFKVVIDYPRGNIYLARTTTFTPGQDEYVRLPFAVAIDTSGAAPVYRVDQPFAGPQQKALTPLVGLEISTIDGQVLTGQDTPTVEALLRGTAGEVRTLRVIDSVGHTESVAVTVEDLLALP